MNGHVEQELLAYLDGEQSPADRDWIEAHLAGCDRCAAELERLRALQFELTATLDAAITPRRLPAAADRRIRERLRARTAPGWQHAVWQQRGRILQAAMALLVVVSTVLTVQLLQTPRPTQQQTLVYGQERLAPGSQAALRVIVRDARQAEPLAGADVVVRIGRTPGLARLVYSGQTDDSGSTAVAFTVPDDLEGQASLVVETNAAGSTAQLVQPITIARSYRLLLGSDKPAYRPGQTLHVRVLALDGVDLRPAAGQPVTFTLLDPAGRQWATQTADASEFGVAALDWELPDSLALGLYTLRAQLGDTVSERSVTVDLYTLPAFDLAVETTRSFATPGERVEGVLQASTFFGRPLTGAQVTLVAYAGPLPFLQQAGQTDADGRFPFALDLPAALDAAALELQFTVVDSAGRSEGLRRHLPIANQPIVIDAVPESGTLKPGVENRVYVLTSYPDGAPVATVLTIAIDGQRYELDSGPFGLAVLSFVPAGATSQFEIEARDAQGVAGQASFTFQADQAAQALLLRAEQAAYEVGQTLRLEALTSGFADGTAVYLDIVQARQTVATLAAPLEDGRAVWAIDLDATLIGTLELHAYVVRGGGELVDDTRLVVVDVPHQVDVTVQADQPSYHPGETARLQFQAAVTPTGQPVQAVLGIAVVDESLEALEALPPGFARAYLLLDQALRERRGQVAALDETALWADEAQELAAQAAWAGAPGAGLTLSARSTAGRAVDPARRTLSNVLAALLALLGLALDGVIVHGLRLGGVLRRALRRVAIGGLILVLASPVLLVFVGGAMWLMWLLVGIAAPLGVLAVALLLLGGLAIHGWRQQDVRVQVASGLLAGYLALIGLLVVLAARGGDPADPLLALVAFTFLLTLAALTALGQGLVVEGWRRAGWMATLLALLLVVAALYLPFVPSTDSQLARTLGNPALYSGPVGWLSGCAFNAAPDSEGPSSEATMAPPEVPEETIPTAPPTATAALPPVEPYPLRQVFPETLYWDAAALTDENGALSLALPLADTVTTWRLTALASTREGQVGVASSEILVRQDLFVELAVPERWVSGEPFTVTVVVNNERAQAQAVQVELVAADWYTLLTPASQQAVDAPARGAAAAHFVLRPERSGTFALQVTAFGAHDGDALRQEVVVQD